MARYPLIMRDQTYVALLQESARIGKSLGKYINEVLDKTASQIISEDFRTELICLTCGVPATFTVFFKGGSVFTCKNHKDIKGKIGEKELEIEKK